MKKLPEENQLTAGQGLPAPVCSPFDIARQVESYAEEKIKETLRSGRLSVWPTVQDGIPGFTISMGMDIYRFVHVESVFEDAEDVSDPGWEKFCEMLESVAALWRECIEENVEAWRSYPGERPHECRIRVRTTGVNPRDNGDRIAIADLLDRAAARRSSDFGR